MREEKRQQALEIAKKIKQEPDNLDNYRALADIYIDEQDFNSAYKVYQEILKHNENDIHALLNSGSIKFYAKQYKEAMKLYIRVIEFEPDNSLAHYNLGNVYAELNMYEDSLKEYKEAVS